MTNRAASMLGTGGASHISAERTASVPDYNAAYSWGSKIYVRTDTANSYVFEINDGDQTDRDTLRFHASEHFRLISRVGGSTQSTNGATLTTNTWYDVWVVRESVTVIRCYVDHVLYASVTLQDVTSRPAGTDMLFGRSEESSTSYSNDDLFRVKFFTRALTIPEMQRESMQMTPWGHDCWGAWPGALLDVSGNGRDMTEVGTIVYIAPPPGVMWGGENTPIDTEVAAAAASGQVFRMGSAVL